MLEPIRTRARDHRAAFYIGLLLVAAIYVALCASLDLGILDHSPYDSYTLQAMAWRDGRIALTQDYSWLEIARFEGKYYISFPPFPSAPMLLLSFVFGENTPSRAVSMAMVLLSYGFGYAIARKRGLARAPSAFAAAFLVAGCNMAEYALYGGVWNIAQAMAFALTAGAFAAALTKGKLAAGGSLVLIACAVGCRPLQAAYVPILLTMAYQSLRERYGRRALRELLPLLIAPALIAAAYGLYNYARFRNPLEFGHTYLPEFLESEFGQFDWRYMGTNLRNILRLPFIQDGRLSFPTAYGFAFWLCNPMYPLYAASYIMAEIAGEARARDRIVFASVALHFAATLCHKSFGGVQFGTRYLCDMIPAMYCFWLIGRRRGRIERGVTAAAMAWAIGFNAYGAWWFHQLVR